MRGNQGRIECDRPGGARWWGVWLLLSCSAGLACADEPLRGALLDQAERMLGSGQASTAATALEESLPKLDAKDRAQGLRLLARAYELLRDEAKRRGDERTAENYQRDLNLLNLRLTQGKPESGATARPRPEEPARAVVSPTVPKPSDLGEAIRAGERGTGKAAEEVSKLPEASRSEPTRPDPTRPQPPAPVVAGRDGPGDKLTDPGKQDRAIDPHAVRAGSQAVAGTQRSMLPNGTGGKMPKAEASPEGALGSRPEVEGRPEDLTMGEPGEHQADSAPRVGASLEQGDLAFSAERYEEALRHYTELAARGDLPEDRREHWVYCRLRAVVQQLNGKGVPDWNAIDRELREIQALSPKNWFPAYLSSVVRERSQAGTGGAQGKRVARPKMNEAQGARR